ncbi:hypothetical protein CBR_g46854 [Chara braunii]|uniref:Uncharacterized protein n=1 Tax=Chara braunii TaxID=69332 RepID=A0A388M131_CHABU|nr:hypothetical protein CBR_g46854 [Chara braunii]|eukprot:GBG88287.1 hypothetical protein CBR_g46854 [Chara braunii]
MARVRGPANGVETAPAPAELAAGHVRIGGGRLDMQNPSRTTQADLRDAAACRPPACPRPTVDNIIRGVSNMRANSDGDVQDAAFRDDDDDGDIEDMEAVDDDDDVEIRSLGKTTGRGKGRGRGGGRGRSGGRGSKGGASDDGGKSATYWSTDDQLRLVRYVYSSEALRDVVARRQARPCLQGAEEVLMHAARSVMHLRGGRQVTKAKKDHRDVASFGGARTDGDGWGRPSRTDDNDVFSTGAPDVQSPSLSSNIRANVGGSSAQVTTRDERIINVEVNEDARVDEGQGRAVPQRSAIQPVTLPTTPRQQRAVVATEGATPRQAVPLPATPRQHHAGDNVRSDVAATAATAVEPPQPRHAGANVGVVAGAPQGATREDRRGEDVASSTEVARAEKKRAGEDDKPLINRVHKGRLAKDLAEQARLRVDDKSFWTSGEGRRLYNIINETREHLVAVASGFPLPNVPRSVAMPRSNIAHIRITNEGQLQGALSRASKVQSVALRVLHGWSSNRAPENEDTMSPSSTYRNLWRPTSHARCGMVRSGETSSAPPFAHTR